MNEQVTTGSQAEILALLGKIVAQWNYAEHCSRQIIRKRLPQGNIDDPVHIHLSKQTPKWMEDELRDNVLPAWGGSPGEPFLVNLIAAFSAARDYRNYYVHGVMATVGQPIAQAIIVPAKPHNGRTQAMRFATAADLWPIAMHLETLGHFACEVGNAFGTAGERAENSDGSNAVAILPQLIEPLPAFPFEPLLP